MLSRAEAVAFRAQAQMLAMQIGVRPAARALGLKETRVQSWSKRYKWNIAAIRPNSTNASLQPNATEPIKALQAVMAQEADRTRSAMARTARRAFEHADTLDDAQLHEMPRSIALNAHARNAGIAHAWNQAQANVAVQVNVPMPDQAERDEMRSIDAKLDAIAAKLKE